jgi:tRNA(fMet)-specific endonuclease VapC
MILLDTDALTHFLDGQEKISQRVAAATDQIAITVVTKYEILRGRFDFLLKAADAEQLLRAMKWLDLSERSLDGFKVMTLDDPASREFEKLLKIKGLKRAIRRPDLLTASIALANKAILVTRNLRHFHLVPGLRSENWVDS